jgi:predicted amidophosphoribosyltransferase
MVITKICSHCQKEFLTDNRQRIFCDDKCRRERSKVKYHAKVKEIKERIESNDTEGYFNFDDYKNLLI